MTVAAYAQTDGLRVLVEGDGEREITGGYCGDLLSWVMGRAKEGDCWFTVMGNVNAIAVAVLADVACIVLAEGSPLDPDAAARARGQGVTVLQSVRPIYELSLQLASLLEK